jgi:hypothetical protein
MPATIDDPLHGTHTANAATVCPCSPNLEILKNVHMLTFGDFRK